MILTIKNSTHYGDLDTSNGVGLQNVINRIRLYVKRNDIITIESNGPDQGTKITICLPLEKEVSYVSNYDC